MKQFPPVYWKLQDGDGTLYTAEQFKKINETLPPITIRIPKQTNISNEEVVSIIKKFLNIEDVAEAI